MLRDNYMVAYTRSRRKLPIDLIESIVNSDESVRECAKTHGVSPTTVQNWRKRMTEADFIYA